MRVVVGAAETPGLVCVVEGVNVPVPRAQRGRGCRWSRVADKSTPV